MHRQDIFMSIFITTRPAVLISSFRDSAPLDIFESAMKWNLHISSCTSLHIQVQALGMPRKSKKEA